MKNVLTISKDSAVTLKKSSVPYDQHKYSEIIHAPVSSLTKFQMSQTKTAARNIFMATHYNIKMPAKR